MMEDEYTDQQHPYPREPEITPPEPPLPEEFPHKSPEVFPQRTEPEVFPQVPSPEVNPDKTPEIQPPTEN